MAEAVIERAYNPRICVMSYPGVDEFVGNMQHDSLLSLLRFAPKPDSVTVRNTRHMSATFTDFKPEFIPIPIYGKFPGIDESQKLLESVLTPGNDPYLPWLSAILEETTSTVSTFETWAHPVATVLAVNAKTPNPLDALQELFDSSYQHFSSLPFVNAEFLRYFVVVHDEGSNWEETAALFEHVKQKFGPHSGILRLGSSQDQQNTENTSALIRDVMSKSVVPFMEECCAVWYEQIAASKQGFAGRLLNVGRRYLTNSSKLTQNVLEIISRKTQRYLRSPFADQPLRSPYHVDGGYYHWSAPQAQLRKIADFAVMLRDYKFAHGIYELLRKEYISEKAWAYAAASQEMACITSLLVSASPLAKDTIIDSLMDSSVYTYISRCHLPLYALRCTLTVTDLLSALPLDLKLSALNHLATACAIKWLTKALSEQLATPLSYPVMCERIACVYQSYNERKGAGVCGRERKASFWYLAAARSWLEESYLGQSERCFLMCKDSYEHKDLAQYPLYKTLTEKLSTA